MGLFKKKQTDEQRFQLVKLPCPRDDTMMDKLKHPSGAVLDVCPTCGGMWLDRDEVMVLYKSSSSKGKAAAKPDDPAKEGTKKAKKKAAGR